MLLRCTWRYMVLLRHLAEGTGWAGERPPTTSARVRCSDCKAVRKKVGECQRQPQPPTITICNWRGYICRSHDVACHRLRHWLLRWIVVAHPKVEPLLSRAHADFLWGVAVLLSFKFVQGDSWAMSFGVDAKPSSVSRSLLAGSFQTPLASALSAELKRDRLSWWWEIVILFRIIQNLYDPVSVCKCVQDGHMGTSRLLGRPLQTENCKQIISNMEIN